MNFGFMSISVNYRYHIVFIAKYREKSLYGRVRTDVREIIQTLCGYKGVEIVSGAQAAKTPWGGRSQPPFEAAVGDLNEWRK